MKNRVLSGMRPTGAMHLGHYHGALKNWVKMQHEFECYYFVADWHALTTHYDDPRILAQSTNEMVIDWLAAGIEPDKATIFVQSRLPEHAELHVLLSMSTPLAWLERVPTYKDQIEKLKDKDLATYGFLGYPLLQSADILIYDAQLVPVGEDQVPHVEMTREIARRFNSLYGKGAQFEDTVSETLKALGETGKKLAKARKAYTESGNQLALEAGRKMISEAQLSSLQRECLMGYLDGAGRTILIEPKAMLTEASKLPGLDGAKMSKSYNNTIALREAPEQIEAKIKRMPTDPARIKRTDAGNPDNCPVWQFHQVYSDAQTKDWARNGCTTAGIGCIECKMPIVRAVQDELAPIRERAIHFASNPNLVREVVGDGCARAQKTARETMSKVREAMGVWA